MAAPLKEVIEFLKDFGFFDIVLPFLLVFTVVFAVLEKTEIFGKDKKNINSMIAFVIGLLFVAVTEVVEVVQEALPHISVLLIVLMSFMMLVGFFISNEDGKHFFDKNPALKWILIIVVMVGTTIIFLDAIGWWDNIWDDAGDFFDSTTGVSIIFLAIIVFAVMFIARDRDNKGDKGGG